MRKEQIINFLKPDRRKIVLTIILSVPALLITYIDPTITYKTIGCANDGLRGFPLAYYRYRVGCPSYPTKFNFIFLAVDIVILYFASCFIIWLYNNKFKKVKK